MFSFFSNLLNFKEKDILNDKYLVTINDYVYDISSYDDYKNLQSKFFNYVVLNKLENVKSGNKYNISFSNNNKNDLMVSVTKREYIIELLNDINMINGTSVASLNTKLSELSLSA
jgi:hypothetical protein